MFNIQTKTPFITMLIMAQITISVFGGIMFFNGHQDGDKIKTGVLVHNIDLSGLTTGQAKEKLQKNLTSDIGNQQLELVYQGRTWPLRYSDVDARYDFEATLNKALNVGRDGGLLKNQITNFVLSRRQVNIPLVFNYDSKKVNSFLKQVGAEIHQPARDAAIKVQGDEIMVIPEENGRYLPVDINGRIIGEAITHNNSGKIKLIINQIKPELVAKELKDIKDTLSVSVTVFSLRNKNRTQNIIKAVQSLDGVVIRPGKQFSFNSKTGLRLREFGYVDAPVIRNKSLAIDVGGGVCQAATTLYQAVSYAGLKVTERSHHSKPVAYVPLGQDAVVADNQLDLKFINNLKAPIYLNAQVDGDKIIIRLFGKKENNYKVELTSEDIRKINPKVIIQKNPSLYQGTEKIIVKGNPGYKVKVYRQYILEGKVIKKELISQDYYVPKEMIMMVGTKENFKVTK